jgi:hypothetical protein
LGSGYQWLLKLSRPATIGAVVPQVMQTDDVLKKYANDFSMATMQKWYKTLDKGNNLFYFIYTLREKGELCLQKAQHRQQDQDSASRGQSCDI